MTSARLSLRLKPELKQWLEDQAKQEDRSAGYIATKAIQRMKDNAEAKRVMIQEAMDEAEKGVFVSSEAVHKWMDSWDTENELPFPEPDVFLNPAA